MQNLPRVFLYTSIPFKMSALEAHQNFVSHCVICLNLFCVLKIFQNHVQIKFATSKWHNSKIFFIFRPLPKHASFYVDNSLYLGSSGMKLHQFVFWNFSNFFKCKRTFTAPTTSNIKSSVTVPSLPPITLQVKHFSICKNVFIIESKYVLFLLKLFMNFRRGG